MLSDTNRHAPKGIVWGGTARGRGADEHWRRPHGFPETHSGFRTGAFAGPAAPHCSTASRGASASELPADAVLTALAPARLGQRQRGDGRFIRFSRLSR